MQLVTKIDSLNFHKKQKICPGKSYPKFLVVSNLKKRCQVLLTENEKRHLFRKETYLVMFLDESGAL